MEGVVDATSQPLYPRERPGIHPTGGWMDRQGRCGRVWRNGNLLYRPGFETRTEHVVAIQTTQSLSLYN